ncbi:hypothetical protein [Burkholderia gladioli]|uniref:Transposase n=1 Tax=Burkholderia gladioli TaxID=28095 RepID=A0AB38U5Z7_BURGA|nr:hypothetical protein [Burkholderia gladioli]MBJ9711952.1 hypothetical protein [Burkholderia gladioli]MCH7273569.1 hypothetical protein [Burkholderia gladioli]MDZ4041553.1 hypothetical protein [Burkholderia gladioli pv. alliicola]UWX75392.1 hypothetical protein NYZ96_35770 [Burkholderia gladioli]
MRELRFLLTAVNRLIVTADRHPAGARCVLRLAVLYSALELARMAVALAGG